MYPLFHFVCRTRSAALKLEADLDATCLEKGWTPLMHASSRGNLTAIDALLAAGARVNQLSNPTGDLTLTLTLSPLSSSLCSRGSLL